MSPKGIPLGSEIFIIGYRSLFPIASSALSKKRIIPKNRKNTPNPVNPIPIFCVSVKEIMAAVLGTAARAPRKAQGGKLSREK